MNLADEGFEELIIPSIKKSDSSFEEILSICYELNSQPSLLKIIEKIKEYQKEVLNGS